MLCSKFGWNSPSSFIDKVEIMKCLQTDEQTGRVNEKSSGELCIRWAKNYKVEISFQEMLIYIFLNVEQICTISAITIKSWQKMMWNIEDMKPIGIVQ